MILCSLQKGWTPLTLASAGGHCDIIRTLLDHGADVNKKTAVSVAIDIHLTIDIFFVLSRGSGAA